MNANETTQKTARQIFEAGDSFAECCEAAASENAGQETREEGSEKEGLEKAGGDSESGVISCEAKRQETFAEVSARILREFCDRLGIAHERYPEHFVDGPDGGLWPSAIRRGLRGPQGPCEQSPAAAERRQTRDWANSRPVESTTPGEV